MKAMLTHRKTAVVLACVAQLALVGVAMGDRLSARFTGEEYLLEVAPLDPIDPFRGAYVTLDYPGIPNGEDRRLEVDDLYVPLVLKGDVWVGTTITEERPDDGPYLSCNGRDWRLRCGIESYFASEEKAFAIEREIRQGTAVARVRIDDRGNAVVVAVEGRDAS
ncbi:MAG TPA: GDYXXLXY domain-containing protein [Nocardioidaceae bacterium]|nr:GDYXXLXY domain-containing protein [Nocardioidaceae bacterium]